MKIKKEIVNITGEVKQVVEETGVKGEDNALKVVGRHGECKSANIKLSKGVS